MGKKSATSTTSESLFQDDLVFIDGQESNDLSFWEFVNPSDVDSDAESLVSVENGFVSWHSLSATSPPKSPNSDQEMETQVAVQDQDVVDDENFGDGYGLYQHEAGPVLFPVVGYGLHDDEEDEEDNNVDGYGLDDELVPWDVSAKLGRQRMRKLGKRMFAKMGNSKRNPYSHVKRGCVRGKHGLGIKA